ncbi:MAG: hypothetical protein BWY81_00909 [Firmicutes bacterium ADurb.Bin467]|nr:MAG: hypothetical protein BWY81_00909 [Firmicutes bacterium ADurb.Bin467]
MPAASAESSTRALMRAVTSPGPQYSASVGFSLWNRSISFVSTIDSPTPKIRKNRDSMCAPDRSRRYGASCRSNMSISSRGGPGSTATAFLPDSTMQPGAVPCKFGMMIAPRGKYACFRLFSVISRPMRRMRSSIAARLCACRSIGSPKNSPTISFVRSSSVGPSPPVVITMSARESPSAIAAFTRAGLSPTVVWR